MVERVQPKRWKQGHQPKPMTAKVVPLRAPLRAIDGGAKKRIGEVAVARSKRKKVVTNPFAIPQFPPSVDKAKLAQDETLAGQLNWAGQSLGGADLSAAWEEGLAFPGYSALSLWAQRAENRILAEIISQEMTRKWIRLTITVQEKEGAEKAKADKIKQLEDELERLHVQDVFRKVIEDDGFFGRGHIFLDLCDLNDADELKVPVGNGSDALSRSKIGRKHPIKGLRTVEPVWTYPVEYNTTDPLKPDWYKPSRWMVMGREVHASRLMTIIGREVPDLLKPAYSFGGLSVTQMVKPYVDNWLRTRQSVSDLLHSFSVMVLKTDLMTGLMAEGEQLFRRIDLFNNLRDNHGLMALDKDTEDFTNVSAPLSGLHELLSKSQEQMASVARIPLVKLLGIQPSGLNACLVGDTLIETDAGYLPIKDVRPGHKVMTRVGFAPVAKAGCTAYTTELIEIKTDSLTIRCTGNHPIWIESTKEFVNAKNVKLGDLLLCRGVTANQNTASRLYGEDASGGVEKMATTKQGHHLLVNQDLCSIEKFGGFITDLFQKAITYVTSTGIVRTIKSAILRCIRHPTISSCMAAISRRFVLQPVLSVDAALAGNYSFSPDIRGSFFATTNADLQIDGKTGHPKPSHDRFALARFAANFSKRNAQTPNIAPESAVPRAKIEPPTRRLITESIEKSGRSTQNVGIECVVSSVKRILASEFVYDIQVAQGYPPEFFANGICVHNSSEGEIRTFYDTIAALQKRLLTDPLRTVIHFVMLSLWGEIDDDISFVWIPLWSLDERGEADLNRAEADTDSVLIETGIISPEEARRRVASKPDSPYASLDVEDVPIPPSEVPEPDDVDVMSELTGKGGEGEGGAEPEGGLDDPQSPLGGGKPSGPTVPKNRPPPSKPRKPTVPSGRAPKQRINDEELDVDDDAPYDDPLFQRIDRQDRERNRDLDDGRVGWSRGSDRQQGLDGHGRQRERVHQRTPDANSRAKERRGYEERDRIGLRRVGPTADRRQAMDEALDVAFDEWDESQVKRGGNPDNPGQFSKQAGSKKGGAEKETKATERATEATTAAKPPFSERLNAPDFKTEEKTAGPTFKQYGNEIESVEPISSWIYSEPYSEMKKANAGYIIDAATTTYKYSDDTDAYLASLDYEKHHHALVDVGYSSKEAHALLSPKALGEYSEMKAAEEEATIPGNPYAPSKAETDHVLNNPNLDFEEKVYALTELGYTDAQAHDLVEAPDEEAPDLPDEQPLPAAVPSLQYKTDKVLAKFKQALQSKPNEPSDQDKKIINEKFSDSYNEAFNTLHDDLGYTANEADKILGKVWSESLNTPVEQPLQPTQPIHVPPGKTFPDSPKKGTGGVKQAILETLHEQGEDAGWQHAQEYGISKPMFDTYVTRWKWLKKQHDSYMKLHFAAKQLGIDVGDPEPYFISSILTTNKTIKNLQDKIAGVGGAAPPITPKAATGIAKTESEFESITQGMIDKVITDFKADQGTASHSPYDYALNKLKSLGLSQKDANAALTKAENENAEVLKKQQQYKQFAAKAEATAGTKSTIAKGKPTALAALQGVVGKEEFANLVEQGKQAAATMKKRDVHLTDGEAALIMSCVQGGSSYLQLNERLRAHSMQALTPEYAAYEMHLSAALSKMPQWQGTVTRGVAIDNDKQLKFESFYKKNHIVVNRQYSAAGKESAVFPPAKANKTNYTMTITGTAADISDLSSKGGGAVVFGPLRHAKVVENSNNTIVLQVLD